MYRGLSGGVGCEVPRNLGPLLKDIFFTGLGEIPWRVFSCVSLLNQTRLPSETKIKDNSCKHLKLHSKIFVIHSQFF